MSISENSNYASPDKVRGIHGNRAVLIWRDIKEAITGSDLDFTSGSIGRAIFILSLPMVLEMIMESIFAVVDIFFVSRLGAEAVAGVGLTESLMTIIYAICGGLSMATTAVVARRVGEKKYSEAGRATVQAVIVGTVVSAGIGIPGVIFAPRILTLMGAAPEVVDMASGYTLIMLGGNILIMFLFIMNAVFRGAGDAAIAMRVLWLGNIINIILDPCLILGLGPFPQLGVTGAAVATVIGRGAGVLYQFYSVLKGKGRLTIRINHLRIDWKVIKKILRLSSGGIGQYLIATTSWIGLMRIMSTFGSQALAGYTIAIRILIFSLLPSWGLSNAAATLVGQNLGAGQPDRAEKSAWICGLINMAFLGVIAAIFILFAEQFMRIFTPIQPVVEVGAVCLRYLSFGYLFYAFGMVMPQAFNGAGDTTTPTIINFFCFWILEIPLAYLLANPLGYSENGVFLAITISESVAGVVGILLFRRGRWKERQV